MIGATNDQPYRKMQSQLDIILIHIDAEFALNVSRVEFGLKKEKKMLLGAQNRYGLDFLQTSTTCMQITQKVYFHARKQMPKCGLGSHILRSKYLLIPIGKCHHNVECSSNENSMEQWPRVCDAAFFVIPNLFMLFFIRVNRFRSATFMGC